MSSDFTITCHTCGSTHELPLPLGDTVRCPWCQTAVIEVIGLDNEHPTYVVSFDPRAPVPLGAPYRAMEVCPMPELVIACLSCPSCFALPNVIGPSPVRCPSCGAVALEVPQGIELQRPPELRALGSAGPVQVRQGYSVPATAVRAVRHVLECLAREARARKLADRRERDRSDLADRVCARLSSGATSGPADPDAPLQGHTTIRDLVLLIALCIEEARD